VTKRIAEKDIEGYLRDEAQRMGWGIHKNISDPRKGGTPGLPDDVITLPSARVAWVECKAPDKLASYLKKRERFLEEGDTTGCSRTEVRQFQEQQKLEDQDQDVSVVGTYGEVDDLIDRLEVLYG